MEGAYVYYTIEKEIACTKNMVKTCESLGKKVELDLYSSISNIGDVLATYGAEKTFNYFKTGHNRNNNIFSEVFSRLFFSIDTYLRIRRRDYEFVYTRDIFFLLFLSLPLIGAKSKVFYESHRPYDNSSKMPNFLESYAIKTPDKIFAVSEGVKAALLNKGVDSEKVTIQRNCVQIYESDRDRVFGDNLEINAEKNRIISYGGSLKDEKGVETLVDAFLELKKSQENLKLVICGPEDGSESLIKKIKSVDDIIFLGYVSQDELFNVLFNSDVLVVPNKDTLHQRYYTCPMKLLDCMASGVPTISSDLPSSQWVARDTVFYFEPEDIESLSDSINKVLSNKKTAQSKADKAFKLVKRNYTWERKGENIYKHVEALKN